MALIATAVFYIFNLLVSNISQVLTFLIFLLASRYFFVLQKKQSLPPGPYGLPLFGYLPFIREPLHKVFERLSHTYGPIFSVSLGTQTAVVLTDPKLIRICLNREEFSNKPTTTTYSIFQNFGLVNVNGALWKQQRKFVHDRLRNLGMKSIGPGREQMEYKIMCEVENLIQTLAVYDGKPVDVSEDFTSAAGNVISSILMSIRFEKTNPIYRRFMELYSEGFKLFLAADIDSFTPKIKRAPNSKFRLNKLKSNHSETMNMVNMFVTKRRKVFDSSVSRDLLDAYLHEEQSGKLEGEKSDRDHTRQIIQVMNDLFSGGQETVASALSWAVIYLIRNPEVVGNIQKDLDKVVGRKRLPSLEDMPNLPYLEATICEILRISTIFPIGPPHSIAKDVCVGNYLLPKGTLIFSNLYSCHMSEKHWTCPEKFDPTRFLDENRNLVKPPQFMAFGVGRRMCVAETLARSELFLFIASIVHVFDLMPSPEGVPSTEGRFAVSHTPQPFKACFIPREISVLPTTSV